MLKAIIFLFISIIFEVIATSCLKLSEGFTVLVPSIIVVIGYSVAFYFLSLSTKYLPLSFVYATWSGVGTILISIVGYFFFKENFDFLKVTGIILIIIGVIFMKFSAYFLSRV